MRKYFFLAIISTLVFISCGKTNDEDDPFIPPPVVELAPEIELSIAPEGVIPYGGEVILTVKTKNAKTVTINGETFPSLDGTKKFTKLIANTELIVIATNINKSTTAKKIATVGDWTTSKTGLLLHNGRLWVEKEHVYVVNGIIVDRIDASNKYKYIFYIDGTFKIYDDNDKLASSGPWTFVDNETKLVFGDPNIFPAYPMPVLNTEELWLSQNTVWLGQPAIGHIVYH